MSHEEKRIIYADNAATTSVHPAVLAEMIPLLGEVYGNPSSLHQKGREAKKYIDALDNSYVVLIENDLPDNYS